MRALSSSGRRGPVYRRPITRLPLSTENDSARPLITVLIARRKELRLTQRDVAERMGSAKSMVSMIEGTDRQPELATLVKYACAVDAVVVVELKEMVPGERRE